VIVSFLHRRKVYAHSYSQKCDVWACGVIMYYLLQLGSVSDWDMLNDVTAE
jgi:hypothetical protein